MRLFIYEDVCGGGCSDPELQAAILPEATAMLQALVMDFSRSACIESNITELTFQWNTQLGAGPFSCPPIVSERSCPSVEKAQDVFLQNVHEADVVVIIAPEIGGRLAYLCESVEQSGVRSLNATVDCVQLCTDKLALARHLSQHGIPTLPTCRLQDFTEAEMMSATGRYVIKPRDGVGSFGIRIHKKDELRAELKGINRNDIIQPYLEGIPCSVGCIRNAETGQMAVLPAGRQRLSDDGTLKYQGGMIPFRDAPADLVHHMVHQITACLDGLNGYFGIDFLLTQEGEPVVVEINPRLTTSYIGYRQCTSSNLAELFFTPNNVLEINWENGVEFTPETVTRVTQAGVE